MASSNKTNREKLFKQEKNIVSLENQPKAPNESFKKARESSLFSKISEQEEFPNTKSLNQEYLNYTRVLESKIANQNKKIEGYLSTIGALESQLEKSNFKFMMMETSNKLSEKKLKNLEKQIFDLKSIIKNSHSSESSLQKKTEKKFLEPGVGYHNLNSTECKSISFFNPKESSQDYSIESRCKISSALSGQNITQGKPEIQNQQSITVKNFFSNDSKLSKNVKIDFQKSSKIKNKAEPSTQSKIAKESFKIFKEVLKSRFPNLSLEKILEIITKHQNYNLPEILKIFQAKECDNIDIPKSIKVTKDQINSIENLVDNIALPGVTLIEKLEFLFKFVKKLQTELNSSNLNEIYEKIKNCISNANSLSKPKIVECLNIFSTNNYSVLNHILSSVEKLNIRIKKISSTLLNIPITESLTKDSDYSENKNILKNIIEGRFQKGNYECENCQRAFGSCRKLLSEIEYLESIIVEKDEIIQNTFKDLEFNAEENQKLIIENQDLIKKKDLISIESKKIKDSAQASERKLSSIISSLNNKLDALNAEHEEYKKSVSQEKNQLFDHMIMIEQENSKQLANFKLKLEEVTLNLRKHEFTLEKIESELGSAFKGDYIQAIRSLTKKKKKTSFSLNPFKKSDSKPNSPSDLFDPIKLQKELEYEKKLNYLNSKQLEDLKEAIRHLEYEQNKNSENTIYKNLRNLLVEFFKDLPVL